MAKSSRQCWFAAASAVQVDVGAQLTAHVSGVHRCGSSWSCPVCAPVVRERRAVEVDEGLERHLAGGGGGLFLTLTLRHGRRDVLADRLEVIAEAMRLVFRGDSWDRRRDRLGYVGAIKAVEVTWGEANGWHPHAHIALLFDRQLEPGEVEDLDGWIFGRWSKIARDRELGTVSREHGIDLREITTGEGVGRYVTKVVDGWSAGHELARGDRKSSSPLQLLRAFVETGETRFRDLWVEYEAATMGKRSLRWSPGLKERLALVEDVSDQELAASEGVDLTLFRAVIEAGDWQRVLKAGATGELLSLIEDGAALLLGLFRLRGHDPQPLDVPRGGDRDGTKQGGPGRGRASP